MVGQNCNGSLFYIKPHYIVAFFYIYTSLIQNLMGIITFIALLIVVVWIYWSWITKEPNKQYISQHPPEQTKQNLFENELTVWVSGVHVPKRKSYILNNLFEGIPVDLIPEPTNKFDANAIKVVESEVLIGYIPADKISIVKPILLNDHYVEISEMEEEESYSKPGTIHLKVYITIYY